MQLNFSRQYVEKIRGIRRSHYKIEVFAKITILVLSLPVLSALLQTIRGFQV